ncbi:MAG: hypothetical protein WBW33_02485 [Bryobacteraceae bacterium]
MSFNADRFFRHRGYTDYSCGIATDLRYHLVAHFNPATAEAFPTRVSGLGGLWIDNDGREIRPRNALQAGALRSIPPFALLKGLLDYERAGRKSASVTMARKRAENCLLERRMFRSLRTGEVIDKRWLRFSYPSFWHYNVLRGLDYLQNAGIKPDSRVDAIDIVIQRRHQNGR